MLAVSEGTVSLVQELQRELAAYVEGRAPLGDLRRWLGAHVPAIYDADEPEAQAIADEAWLLLSELDARERDEASVRAEVSRYAYPRMLSIAGAPAEALTKARRVRATVTSYSEPLQFSAAGLVLQGQPGPA
jgi:hypothetical protein